jgi:hypothetical protein
MLCSYVSGYGQSWLQSPVLIVPTGGALLTFKHFYNDYGPGANLSVRFSNDGGATWITGYAFASGGGNVGPATQTVAITLSGNVIIQWYIDGDHYQIDYWYVDDVCVYAPLAHDAETVSIDMPPLIQPGSIAPLATVGNKGTNTETFNVTMTITPGTYTSTKQVQNLAPLTETQVTFDPWNATVGNYTITVCTQLAGDLDPTNDCINNQPVSVQVLRKVYAYVAYDPSAALPEGPAWFYVQTPGTITSLAATTSDQFISAGAWANDVWYGSEYYDASVPSGGGWWTIDPVTGAMNKVGDFDIGFAGIAYDKNSGIMYGTNWDGAADDLYTIDPLTGTPTLIADNYSTQLSINLAAAEDGNLYAIGLLDDQLYRITPTIPPVIVAVGPTGQAFNYAQDMEYDWDNDIMYAAGYAATGTLYTVDYEVSGACAAIGNFQGGAEMTGFAIPYTLGHRVYGNVYYGLTDTKPMETLTTITLTPGSTIPTGTGGAYEFSGIADGAYNLTAATTKAWNGMTTFDATLILRYTGGVITFTNLQKRAADVNKTNTINGVTTFDATLILRRAASQPTPQWTAPPFVYDGPYPATPYELGLDVTVSGADVNVNLRMLCSGDINGSYTPWVP